MIAVRNENEYATSFLLKWFWQRINFKAKDHYFRDIWIQALDSTADIRALINTFIQDNN